LNIQLSFLAITTAFGLTACNNDGDSGTSPVSGVLLDSAAEGVAYTASPSGQNSMTDSTGRFNCQTGDTVTFKIGGIELGKVSCASTVTPLELAGIAAWTGTDDKVNNRLLFVQSLDEDDDPSNGIKVTSAVASSLASKTLDFTKTASSFNTDLAAVLPALADKFGNLYSGRVPNDTRRNVAKEHFESTLATALGQSSTSKVTQASVGGEVGITKYVLSADAALYIPYEGANANAKTDFSGGFFPAVGSGLAYKGKAADGSLEFYGITDRGPNGDSPNAPIPGNTSTTSVTKMFPAPSFTPSIALISLGKDGARVKSLLPIKSDANTKINGRPLPAGTTGSSGEVPLTDGLVFDAAKANFDANGLDPESLIYDASNKVFWTSDEYGPFVVKIDAVSGVILKKYKPGTAATDLPDVLKNRRANRGMEGLTMSADGKLHGFLQSPIDPLDSNGASIKAIDAADLDQDGKKDDTVNVRDFAQFARWMAFDPVTESAKLYAYPLSYPLSSAGEKWDRNRTGSAKLGDLVALPNGKFIVIEQGTDGSGKVRNFLMLVEVPATVTDISSDGIELEKNSIDGATASAHPWAGLVTLKKTLLLDLNAIGWSAEKAEGLSVVDGQTLSLINDNDFGLRTTLIDASGKSLEGDITACTVDVSGTILSNGKCTAGATGGRVTRAFDSERPTRLWLIKLPKALTAY
jgi:hypothetical protein